ncbi:uncharacterized protein ACO6RY_02475 [Pungitius sinensis]
MAQGQRCGSSSRRRRRGKPSVGRLFFLLLRGSSCPKQPAESLSISRLLVYSGPA